MDLKTEILLIDDHPMIVEAVCRILDGMSQIATVDTANTGDDAISLIKSRSYGLYIVDVSLPDISGFELIDIIRKKDEDARIIIHTMHEEVWYVNRLINAGVNAIVLKASDPVEIRNAVINVLDGEVYTCPRFERIKQKLQASIDKIHPKDRPTKREQEILSFLAKGLSTNEIANELGISQNTVETFRKRLIQKFDAKNGIDLVMKAHQKGWVE